MDHLLLPLQHFLERMLKKVWVLQNSNDVIVTSILNQSQQNFVILLEMPSCTIVPIYAKSDCSYSHSNTFLKQC